MTETPRPGWYPDPADDAETAGFRWWDGTGWSDHTADHAYAPAPDGSGAAPHRRPSRMVRAVAWTVVVALVLSTAAGALLLLWSGPSSSGGATPDRALATAGGQLDERARRASIGPVSMDLPGVPYQMAGGAHQLRGVLDTAFLAEAAVHQRTAEHGGWSAVTLLASVHDGLVGDVDLGDDARATVDRLATTLYGDGPTELAAVDVADHAVDGHGGIRVTARVHYTISGLPSRYDDLTAILVRLDDGSVVVALSSVPDDASAEVRQLAAASLASLRVD